MRFTKLIVFFIILQVPLLSVQSSIFNITDPSNDVRYYYRTTILKATGNFHDEIDIIGFDINNSNFVILYEGEPLNDYKHLYKMTVYWDGDETSINKTSFQFGFGVNAATTRIYDNQFHTNRSILAVNCINASFGRLEMLIPGYDLIKDPANPSYIEGTSIYLEDAYREYYIDNLTYSNITKASNYSIGTLIFGISINLLILFNSNRRK